MGKILWLMMGLLCDVNPINFLNFKYSFSYFSNIERKK